MVRRLSAGGNRIRTIGPALAKGVARLLSAVPVGWMGSLSTGRLARRRWLAAEPARWPPLSPRDKWFESVFLQRGVRCEPDFRGRIHHIVIPGGGLNSTVAGLATHPFNPSDEFKGEFRVITADLRNAKGGQSSGPFEVDRPWDAYTDDHIGLMDHLGIRDLW
jgi:hypothetical protein